MPLACGAAAARCIEQAVALARRDAVSAIVTAPIHKEALAAAGVGFPGHTEMLQALAAAPGEALPPVRMMLANEELRVVLVTIHMSLRDAIEAVTYESVLERLGAIVIEGAAIVDLPELGGSMRLSRSTWAAPLPSTQPQTNKTSGTTKKPLTSTSRLVGADVKMQTLPLSPTFAKKSSSGFSTFRRATSNGPGAEISSPASPATCGW